MHNLSDDELDRLSREAAEHQLEPASASLWDKIVVRLDKEMPKGPGFNYHIIPDLALLLLLLVGIPFANNLSGKRSAIAINDMSKTAAPAPLNSIAEKKPPVSATRENYILPLSDEDVSAKSVKAKSKKPYAKPADNLQITSGKKNENTGDPTRTVYRTIEKTKFETTRSGDGGNGPDLIHSGKPKTGKPGSVVSNAGQKEINSKRFPGIIQVDESPAPVPSGFVVGNADNLILPPVVLEMEAKRLSLLEKEKLNAEAAAKKKMDQGDQSTNLLELGVVWSPDISKVGSASAAHVGSIYGLTAGFNFNKRWSVQTGFLYSEKYYTSTGGEYQKIPGYPYNPQIKIIKVNAECLMWDLPVNVRYNWLYRPAQRAFVSAGLSSYFMKQEDLHYWYEYGSMPGYKRWVNNNSSSYWFSVLNLSAGFEQRIIEGLTVQAEPFFKVAVRDIGYGKINLKSYGIFLGLKYIPPFHRSKK